MGVLVTVVLRTFFYLLAVLTSIVSSFVLVRKLPPSSYGVFQLISRRIAGYTALPVQLLGFWAYRYEAEKLGGGRCLIQFAAAYTVPALALGFAVSQLLGLQGLAMLLTALLLSSRPLQAAVQTLLSSLRPVRYSIAILLYRLVYGLAIIALVYLASRGLEGALAAALLATVLASLVGYGWVKKLLLGGRSCRRLLGEWVRAVHTPALAHATSTIASLDAVIAYTFWGPETVAAYFAISIPATLVVEVVSTGLSYIPAYALATGDVETAYKTARILSTAAVALLAYLAAHPWWTTLLVNPAYQWATIPATIIAVARIIDILNASLNTIYSGVQKGGVKASKKLSKLNMYTLTISTAYTATLATTLHLAKNREEALAAWTLATLATSIANLTLLAKLLEREGSITARETRKTIAKTIAYTVVGLTLATQLPPKQPTTPKLVHVVEAAIPTLPAYMLVYAVIYIVDPETRTLLAKIASRLHHLKPQQRLQTQP